MKYLQMVITIFFFISCSMGNYEPNNIIDNPSASDDGNAVKYSKRPELIPRTTGISDDLPDVTEKKIVSTIPASELKVFNINFIDNRYMARDCYIPTTLIGGSYLIDIYYGTIGVPNDGGLDYSYPNFIYNLIENGSPRTGLTVDYRCYTGNNVGFAIFNYKNPLLLRPVKLQLYYYYKKIFQHIVVPGESLSAEASWSEGVETSKTNTFSTTLGMSKSISSEGGWGSFKAQVSCEVSEEQSEMYSSTDTVYASKSYTDNISFTPQEDATYIYAVWQKVEGYQFVDNDNNVWKVDDLGYPIETNTDGSLGFEVLIPKSTYSITTTDAYF